MNSRILTALLLLAGLGLSQDQATREPAPPQAVGGSTPVEVSIGTVRKTIQRTGTFVPAGADDLSLDLRIYRGELRLIEIRPHGSFVNEGDVIARFETRGIDRQITADDMALERAVMAMRHADEDARVKAQGWVDSLERAERASLRAAKRLEGFRKFEKGFKDESERLSVQAREHRLEDQLDELTQLEKMYTEDELVDATEEIVLKRQRRNFARTKANHELSEQRRLYNKKFFEQWREEDLVVEARLKEQSLRETQIKNRMAREKLESEIAKRRYDLGQSRERNADLKRERESLVVRTPRRGLLLHGAADAAPWAARFRPGATVKNRQVFLSVLDPKSLKLRTSIEEKQLPEVRNGAAVEVAPVTAPEKILMGRIRVDYLPGKDGRFPAEVELVGSEVGLRPGMTAQATVIVAEAKDVIVVPLACVHERADGGRYVFCLTAEGRTERDVVTGLDDGERVAILSGLREGEKIDLR